MIVDRFLFGLSLPDSVAAPRVHEQWKPAELVVERYGFSPETRAKLSSMGYAIEESVANAKLHALERFSNGRVWGTPDSRGERGRGRGIRFGPPVSALTQRIVRFATDWAIMRR